MCWRRAGGVWELSGSCRAIRGRAAAACKVCWVATGTQKKRPPDIMDGVIHILTVYASYLQVVVFSCSKKHNEHLVKRNMGEMKASDGLLS